MHTHTYVRLNGWGLTVLPTGDFDASWDEATGSLDLQCHDGKFARLHPDGGGYRSQIDSRTTQSLHDVAAITRGDADPRWRIETSLYRFVWPAGYQLVCRAADAPEIVMDLLGPGGECLFLQNPRTMPPLEMMAGPGQAILDQDDAARSVLLGYTIDGTEWRQRHIVVTVGTREFAVTGQAPASAFAGVERALQQIVSTLESTPD